MSLSCVSSYKNIQLKKKAALSLNDVIAVWVRTTVMIFNSYMMHVMLQVNGILTNQQRHVSGNFRNQSVQKSKICSLCTLNSQNTRKEIQYNHIKIDHYQGKSDDLAWCEFEVVTCNIFCKSMCLFSCVLLENRIHSMCRLHSDVSHVTRLTHQAANQIIGWSRAAVATQIAKFQPISARSTLFALRVTLRAKQQQYFHQMLSNYFVMTACQSLLYICARIMW